MSGNQPDGALRHQLLDSPPGQGTGDLHVHMHGSELLVEIMYVQMITPSNHT